MDEKRITKFTLQKKNPNRVNVFLDEEFAFGLTKQAAYRLKIGQILTENEIVLLQEKDKDAVVYQKALSLLDRKLRTANELRMKLREKGFDEDCIASVIERLQENQLIDDKRYSALWVENQSLFRPRGKRLLAMELRKKGIADTDIHDSLLDVDERKEASECAARYAKRLSAADWQTFRNKLGSYLIRRGFDYGIARETVERVWAQREGIDEDPDCE